MKTEFRCKHCKNHMGCLVNEKVYIYCIKRHWYPSPKFVEAWGCDDYEKESEQLSLFAEIEVNET